MDPIVLVLVLIALPAFVTNTCYDVTSLVQNDVFMEFHVYKKTSQPTVYECAAECVTSTACLSFNYNTGNSDCQLNDNNTAIDYIVPNPGFMYSSIESWPLTVSGACAHTVPCPGAAKCNVDRLHRAKCIPEFQGCGEPDFIPGSVSVSFDGYFLGAEANYTCDTFDQRACSTNITSVCHTSGWTNMTGLCAQYIWYSPKLGVMHGIPCGAADGFTVNILGNVLNPATTVTVDVRKGGDSYMMVDFQIDGGLTYLTTTIGGLTQTNEVMVLSCPLVPGNSFYMTIQYKNGVYTIIVDGVTLYAAFNEFLSVPPEYINIGDDVILSMVEFV